jgi:general stress protein CsbA
MFNFILEIIFTVLFVVSLIFNAIAGSWLLVTLDAVIIILGIINSILAYKNYKKKKHNGGNE